MDSQIQTLPQTGIYKVLVDAGVVDPDHIEPYAPRVRDRDDIKVYRCARSGVIFLGRSDHMSRDYYEGKEFDGTLKVGDGRVPLAELDNADRQIVRFGSVLKGRDWLDFGCGAAALLRKFGTSAASAWGVEPARWHIDSARADGVNIVSTLAELGDRKFDVITLFHVFEHLLDPIGTARELKGYLKPGGLLLIEVPHAHDFLLETLDSAAFRAFTLWSEHLVLHTRKSLAALLNAAGFASVEVQGLQRYPLSNHLYWLRNGQPGGHDKWKMMNTPELAVAYEACLDRMDQTDTIIGYARV